MMADHMNAEIKSLLSLANRPLQDAKVCGKIVCSECIVLNEGIKFYFDDVGLKQHFKIKHRGKTFDHNVLMECKRRFRELHAEETLNMVKQLSNMRLEADTERIYAKYFVMCASYGPSATIEIVAKCRREAAKLYGLILHHRGFLNKLGGEPCCVTVKLAGLSTDDTGQFFKLWSAAEKIYAESFISPISFLIQ